jgi:hypothetical protein
MLTGEDDEIHEEINFGLDWDLILSILISNAPFGRNHLQMKLQPICSL